MGPKLVEVEVDSKVHAVVGKRRLDHAVYWWFFAHDFVSARVFFLKKEQRQMWGKVLCFV